MVTGFAFGPWAFATGQLQLLWLWHCLTCISAAHRGSPLRLNSPLDPSKPPTYPTCVSAPELQPTYPEILALWNAPLLVWSLGLSGDTHPPLSSIALCSQPLSLSHRPHKLWAIPSQRAAFCMEAGWTPKKPRSRRSVHSHLLTGEFLWTQEKYKLRRFTDTGLLWLEVHFLDF